VAATRAQLEAELGTTRVDAGWRVGERIVDVLRRRIHDSELGSPLSHPVPARYSSHGPQ